MRFAVIFFTSAWWLAASLVHGSPVGDEEPKASWGQLIDTLTGSDASGGKVKVPGSATMWHCKGTGPKDVGHLNFADIKPKVLSKNAPVAVNVSVVLDEPIGEGAIVELSVKYSMVPIKIINRRDPLCTLIKKVGLECPVAADSLAFAKTMMVPNRFIPGGTYHVHVNAYTSTGTPIICLDIDQKFK